MEAEVVGGGLEKPSAQRGPHRVETPPPPPISSMRGGGGGFPSKTPSSKVPFGTDGWMGGGGLEAERGSVRQRAARPRVVPHGAPQPPHLSAQPGGRRRQRGVLSPQSPHPLLQPSDALQLPPPAPTRRQSVPQPPPFRLKPLGGFRRLRGGVRRSVAGGDGLERPPSPSSPPRYRHPLGGLREGDVGGSGVVQLIQRLREAGGESVAFCRGGVKERPPPSGGAAKSAVGARFERTERLRGGPG